MRRIGLWLIWSAAVTVMLAAASIRAQTTPTSTPTPTPVSYAAVCQDNDNVTITVNGPMGTTLTGTFTNGSPIPFMLTVTTGTSARLVESCIAGTTATTSIPGDGVTIPGGSANCLCP